MIIMDDRAQMEEELKDLGHKLDELSHLIERAITSSRGFIGETYIDLVRKQQLIIEEKVKEMRLEAGDEWNSFRLRVAELVRDMLRRVNQILPEDE